MSGAGAPLGVVLVGPTASGKSAVALQAARRRPRAELLSIDSMQVYRGMDIGTAKPSPAERADVRHHLIDLVEPTDEFTLADFQRAFDEAFATVAARRGVPLLVGGTGLYVQAVVDGLDLPGRYPEVRAALDADPDTEALHLRLAQLDPVAAGRMEPANRRRVVRALEVTVGSGRPFSSYGPGLGTYPPARYRMIGIRWPRPLLDRRIEARLERQLEAGLLDEVRRLASRPGGLSTTAAQALGYRELLAHLRGATTLDDAIATTLARTRRFARRQERWFRRDPRVVWVDVGAAGLGAVDGDLRPADGADSDDPALGAVTELVVDALDEALP